MHSYNLIVQARVRDDQARVLAVVVIAAQFFAVLAVLLIRTHL